MINNNKRIKFKLKLLKDSKKDRGNIIWTK